MGSHWDAKPPASDYNSPQAPAGASQRSRRHAKFLTGDMLTCPSTEWPTMAELIALGKNNQQRCWPSLPGQAPIMLGRAPARG
jgi:hypothetical protein